MSAPLFPRRRRIVALFFFSHCLTGFAFLPRSLTWSPPEYERCSMMSKNIPPSIKESGSNQVPVYVACRALKLITVTSAAFFLGNIAEQLPNNWNTVLLPAQAHARNLPTSNGASSANRGTALSLVPIIQLKGAVDTAILKLPDIQECERLLSSTPAVEKDFKKLFDEHSEGVSYKQQFLDQNAFLVYYTKGFDGPGRPSIEAEDESSIKEKGQFGARNDAWVAVDEARGEISYLLEYKDAKLNTKDLKKALLTASKALENYISYDSGELLKDAEKLALDAK